MNTATATATDTVDYKAEIVKLVERADLNRRRGNPPPFSFAEMPLKKPLAADFILV